MVAASASRAGPTELTVEAGVSHSLPNRPTGLSAYSRPTSLFARYDERAMTAIGAKTRERILDQAQRLILDQGLAATSIDQVLTAAGTSKGAFFHHFPTKNHLAR